jgi:Na+-transporting methylmalonyl-CoA/oxaloacetate decarboxylase gamma subunit
LKQVPFNIFLDFPGIGMAKIAGFLVFLIIAVMIGGSVYLAFWDIPPPSTEVVRTLPDSRFPR